MGNHPETVRRQLAKIIFESPLNPGSWAVLLTCGHEAWVESARRPKWTTYHCDHCTAARATAPPALSATA